MKLLLTPKNLWIIIKIIIFMIVVYVFIDDIQQNKERKIYEQNNTNLLTNTAREVTLLPKEFKNALDNRTKAIFDSMHIKSKQIDHYIQTTYTIKDSLQIHSNTVYDSVHNHYTFSAVHGCWNIAGTVSPKADEVTITKEELNDTLDIFQYHDWDKKYLWGLIKCKRYDIAGIYSRCKGDTIKVTKNYSLRKR